MVASSAENEEASGGEGVAGEGGSSRKSESCHGCRRKLWIYTEVGAALEMTLSQKTGAVSSAWQSKDKADRAHADELYSMQLLRMDVSDPESTRKCPILAA